jgi:hypothetical protein
MADKNTRKERFTAQEGDFEIVKPAPKKNTGKGGKPAQKPPVAPKKGGKK